MKRTSCREPVLLAIAAVFALCVSALAQQPTMGPAAIKTADGYVFVQNSTDKSFILEIKGKTVETETAGDNPAFKVNGKLVEILLTLNENFLNGTKGADDEQMLKLHQKWETDYLRDGMYHKKLDVESETISVNGRTAMFWGYARPAYADNFNRDYYLTMIIGNGLLGLSSPLAPGDSVSDTKKLLVDFLSTLKVSDKPFDLAKLAEQIRNGTYKGN